jgi:hypothetical protein
MNKIINWHSLAVWLSVITVIVSIFLLVRSCGGGRIVKASLSSTDITYGESVFYADSTSRAQSWLWEFGNGRSSNRRSGVFTFPGVGHYQVRLSVDGDPGLKKLFMVRVRPFDQRSIADSTIWISAPDSVIQGERVLFTAGGNGKGWKWDFDKNGVIDSREETAIFQFESHKEYTVSLTAENTGVSVHHTIVVSPKFMESDIQDTITVDIKRKLQLIADGRSFNDNYNHIVTRYLRGNPNVEVTINTNTVNDFYSYCQGLRIAGRGKIVIDDVFVEGQNSDSGIDHIIVRQRDNSPGGHVPAKPK